MISLKRRRILETIAAAGLGSSIVKPAFADEREGKRSLPRPSYDRPNVTIINNSGWDEHVSVALRKPGSGTVFRSQREIPGFGKYTTSHEGMPPTYGQFRTDLDFPGRIQQKFKDERLLFQLQVGGKVTREFPIRFGGNGFPEYATLSVDLRDDGQNVGYSVV